MNSSIKEAKRTLINNRRLNYTLPILIIFIYFEKYLVSGLTAGSVKG